MENSLYTPLQVMQKIIQAGEKRVSIGIIRCIILGIMAGGFIALGAATSSVAAHGIADVGTSRLVTGVVFPVGLMMIVLVGGELFTGDCLMVAGVWKKKYSVMNMLKTLGIVWLSNLIGAVIITVLIAFSGIYNYSDGALGAFFIKIANSKCTIDPMTAVCSGILCNILVCIAVLMATSAKEVVGKIMAVFFPIMAFVVGGFEHCVANMFYIPAGIMAALNPTYVDKANELYGISAEQISNNVTIIGFFQNIIPVTIGNVIGAMVFIALPLYFIHRNSVR